MAIVIGIVAIALQDAFVKISSNHYRGRAGLEVSKKVRWEILIVKFQHLLLLLQILTPINQYVIKNSKCSLIGTLLFFFLSGFEIFVFALTQLARFVKLKQFYSNGLKLYL